MSSGEGRANYAVLIGLVLLSFLPAVFGSQFRPGPWFEALRKPGWNPPGWVFGPVWTALYFSMGVAAWLAWTRAGWSAALNLFVLQLVFNGLWTWLFFGLKSPALAFANIVLLWLAVAGTAAAFWQVRSAAGATMLPYLAWATFATALNFTIWRMNASSSL